MKRYAIVVAGGKGTRMGSTQPKQFLPIGGRPVLMHTLEAFLRYDAGMQLVLVLPPGQRAEWDRLCREHRFTTRHLVADGGDTRFQSVKNGLALVQGSGLVGVHDGVRPFVSTEVIDRCYRLAEEHHAVVPATGVIETLRELVPGGSRTVERGRYRLVQTPQVFDADLLREAYAQPFSPAFTDDASVVEALGATVYLAEGNRENIKITTPFDLIIANALLQTCST